MPVLIGIAGPSCSGKSKVCKAIGTQYDMLVIRQDNFFKRTAEMAPDERGEVNWETPDALKMDDFHECLLRLKTGSEVQMPIYKRGICETVGTTTVYPAQMMLVEGFHLYYREDIRDLFDLRLFLVVSPDVQWKRRTNPDRQPNLDPEYFHTYVVGCYERYGMPTVQYAHAVIDANGGLERVVADVEAEIGKRWTLPHAE
ncbi:hypothetical protein HY642_03315 [Candidatus Woesearchaeota archaeon]|nr:hypothetical protein [Candidatus Woesearchaeota archaeon]